MVTFKPLSSGFSLITFLISLIEGISKFKYSASIFSASNFWLKYVLENECPRGYPSKPYLDDLDDDARQIGAVNVIKFTKGLFGKLKLKGYNSDIIGFKQSIDPLLKETHRKALILGTGGASKAVFHGLKQLGVGATLVSRKPKEFCITYDEITPKTMEQYTVIVNTTPLGMFPNIDSCPDIPYDLLTPNHLLYDLLYNPDETLFMKKGKEKGAVLKNGLEMLLLQAFAAWEIWQK